jgi:hypothetical protein
MQLLPRGQPLYRRALALLEQAMGPDYSVVGRALNNLAALYFVQHDWVRAADFWRRATSAIARRAQRDTDDVARLSR